MSNTDFSHQKFTMSLAALTVEACLESIEDWQTLNKILGKMGIAAFILTPKPHKLLAAFKQGLGWFNEDGYLTITDVHDMALSPGVHVTVKSASAYIIPEVSAALDITPADWPA